MRELRFSFFANNLTIVSSEAGSKTPSLRGLVSLVEQKFNPGAPGILFKMPRAGARRLTMKSFKFFVFVLVAVTLLTACSPVSAEQYNAQATQVAELKNQQATQVVLLEKMVASPTQGATAALEPTATTSMVETQAATPEATAALTAVPPTEAAPAVVVSNSLESPKLFDAGEHPAGESTPGFFDIGVNPNQIGIVFGWDLNWNENSISGEGCEIVILPPGWYENFQMLDGRYEIYDLPSSDIAGWTEVLVSQRVAEQATHYGCPADKTPPTWAE